MLKSTVFETNMGTVDRLLRVVVGAALMGAWRYYIDASYSWILLLVGIVVLGTGLLSFCPIYKMLGMSTCKTSSN